MLPVFARDILQVGAEGLGPLRAAPAVGATLTAIVFSIPAAARPMSGSRCWSRSSCSAPRPSSSACRRSYLLSLAMLALLGAADMFSVYIRQSLIQLHTPDAMRGRVAAASTLAISASNELGEARSGFVAALIGPVAATVAGGVAAIGVTLLWAWWFPELRRARSFELADEPPPQDATSSRAALTLEQSLPARCCRRTREGAHAMKANSILDTIGNTPHIRVNRLFGDRAEVWVKSERSNPGASIKDRIALSMIEDAEQSGKLKPGGTIVEPTSGNTGIGLAMVAAVKGYKLILVMPDSMSIERRRLMLAYRRDLRTDRPRQGHEGRGRPRRRRSSPRSPGSWMPQQFDNPANVDVHVRTTAQEILADFRDAPFDALITGVGTGGHITALARVLKKEWPDAQGVRGRAGAVAGHQRRQARPAPDPGARRRFHPDQPRHATCSTA